MKIAIRYYSKTGNTKKLADAISKTTGIPAETVDQPLTEPVDILFLGSSVYAAGVDDAVKKFVATLNKEKVKKVVNFSTAALIASTYKQIKKLLEPKQIPLAEQEFHCRGSFKVMHKGRPGEEDLKAVQEFARSITGSTAQ